MHLRGQAVNGVDERCSLSVSPLIKACQLQTRFRRHHTAQPFLLSLALPLQQLPRHPRDDACDQQLVG
jgi:hypothetical protein